MPTSMRLTAAAFALLALPLVACPPSDGVPLSDTCFPGAATGSLTLLEAGDLEGPFVPFAEGESIPFGIGGQGAAMVYVRLHADGPDVPACFGQQTDVLDADGRVFAQLHSPLNMRPYPDGGFVSGPLYMPFDGGPSSSTVVLRTVAYGVTYEMPLHFGAPRPPLVLTAVGSSASVWIGYNQDIRITMSRASSDGRGFDVTLANSNPSSASLAADTVHIDDTSLVASVRLTGLAVGETEITVRYGTLAPVVVRFAVIERPPPVQTLTATRSVSMVAGGSAIVTVHASLPAQAGGLVLPLSVPSSAYRVPLTVTIPEGLQDAAFRVVATGDALPTDVSDVQIGDPSVAAASTHVRIVPPPRPVYAPSEITITEVHGADAFDSSCDGVTDGVGDQFVEIRANGTGPVSLGGLGVWDAAAFDRGAAAPNAVLPADLILGSGELLVLMGSAPGTMSSAAPWCAGADGAHVGTALALGGAWFPVAMRAVVLTRPDDGIWIARTSAVGGEPTPGTDGDVPIASP